jgi:hypothetical protein
MIAMWEMLKVYAKHHLIHPDTMDDPSFPGTKVFDSKSDYTQRSTTRGDPVPLIPASRLVPLTGIIPAKYYVARPAESNWKFNEMRFAIPAARVVSLSNIRKLPLTCRWMPSVSGSLLSAHLTPWYFSFHFLPLLLYLFSYRYLSV